MCICIIIKLRVRTMGVRGEGWGQDKAHVPPGKNSAIWGVFLMLFLHVEAFLLRFSPYWGPLSPCRGIFHPAGTFSLLLFSMLAVFFVFMGAFFELVTPTLRKFLWAPMVRTIPFTIVIIYILM